MARLFSFRRRGADAPEARRYRPPRHKRRPRQRIRQLFEEAGLHVSATWSELTDWMRLGR